ncbi:hypothetical protein EJ02DRAFT_484823, partial [Clathrospora elynae]|uniref:Uncharacterized protein n=1 Tax=Clathrospora elynae TaxID=706981 RepID=A0A6A5SAN6_9PLEO
MLQTVKEADKMELKLQKAEEKELKAAAQLYKARIAEEKCAGRERQRKRSVRE